MSLSTAIATAQLAMHPTVKPVALVADAIIDCSKRGEIILDRRKMRRRVSVQQHTATTRTGPTRGPAR